MVPEKAFDQSVFKRMEADADQVAAGFEKADGGVQKARDIFKFMVDDDA